MARWPDRRGHLASIAIETFVFLLLLCNLFPILNYFSVYSQLVEMSARRQNTKRQIGGSVWLSLLAGWWTFCPAFTQASTHSLPIFPSGALHQLVHVKGLFLVGLLFLPVSFPSHWHRIWKGNTEKYKRGERKFNRVSPCRRYRVNVHTQRKKRNTRQHLKTACSFYLHFLFFLLHVCWKRCLTLGALSFIPVNHVAGEWHAEMHNKPKWQWE